MSTTTLVWIQRELRIEDAPAIEQALADSNRVILAYFHDSAQIIGEANSVWLAKSLLSLKANLEQYSANLWLLEGDFKTNLSHLISQYDIKQLYYSYQVGSPFLAMQQTALSVCKQHKVTLTPFFSEFLLQPEELQNRQNKPYLVYTPFYKNFLTKQTQIKPLYASPNYKSLLNKAGLVAVPKIYSDLPQSLSQLLEQPWAKKVLAHWQVGEQAAWARAQSFLTESINRYSVDRDYPALNATSQLSSHLHFGEISIRALYFEVQQFIEAGQVQPDKAQPWLRQLVWKEFARHLLYWFAQTESEPFQQKYQTMAWQNDKAQFAKWQKGQTGIPIIDAAMRELWQTGIMHNRLRMLVASFLTKNLNQHWLSGKAWFDNTLLDADPANNVMGW
ncbi:MAG: deoxyribodipyrimidine photo-lyase, partial [Thiomicrorhabdus sp.]|nr:deoxyribodipyrimidine photo-lyase [Thiomicrorhabdus sp.]